MATSKKNQKLNKGKSSSKVPVKVQASSDTLVPIINTVADRVDQIIKLVTNIASHSLEAKKAEARFRVHISWVAAVIILIIVGIAGALTYFNKIDGSTFGFLLGTVVGYILTFIRDAVYPPEE